MCSCHSILECCVMFSGVKLSIGSFVLFLLSRVTEIEQPYYNTSIAIREDSIFRMVFK